MNASKLDKGGRAEEALRQYFARSGCFVLRGLALEHGGELVSDVDLWLYARPTPFSRTVTIVDVKNKKSAKPFERILWAKGLQAALRADQAVIATSDQRGVVSEYARSLGVVVLGGDVLQRIVEQYGHGGERLVDSEFWAAASGAGRSGAKGGWVQRTRGALARAAGGLGYDALNAWIDDAVFFASEALRVPGHAHAAVRSFYLLASLVCVGADYASREVTFLEPDVRRRRLHDGLQLGSAGEAGHERLLGFAQAAVTAFVDPSGGAAAKIRKGLETELSSLPSASLAEFFSRTSVARDLFGTAVALEAASHSRALPFPSALPTEAQSVIGALLDYGDIDRARFYEAIAGAEASTPARETGKGKGQDELSLPDPPPVSDGARDAG